MKKQQGILLVNLGTPKSPRVKDVRFYLAEFLGDKRVVDLPYILRMGLLYGVILPIRPKKSAKAYAKIWDPRRGSPLMYHTHDMAQALQLSLGTDYVVEYAMRYGEPKIESTIDKLIVTCDTITIIPLFPQYASATTGSVLEKIYQYCASKTNIPALKVINRFYDNPHFIESYANNILQNGLLRCARNEDKQIGNDDKQIGNDEEERQENVPRHCEERSDEAIHTSLQNEKKLNYYDKILFSFHSLPVRQNEKSGSPTYRMQCEKTAMLIAKKIGINQDQMRVAFQSRLGRIPWLGPDITDVLEELAAKGDKRLLVACPSFVTDCLETLEEIGMRASEEWLSLGGESLRLVPCLNANSDWIKGMLGTFVTETSE